MRARALETAVELVGERTVRQVQFVRLRVVAGLAGRGQLGPAGAGVAPSVGGRVVGSAVVRCG